ncbi:Vps5-domain-containing protein, partial [Neoconidiobolus thromboides FSU 785]
ETFKIPPKGILPVFNISISNPRKVNDALNPYTMYRISTWTNSTAYKKKEFAVERRFRDFLWLYEQLSSNNQGIIVPPPPEKNAIGRFQDDFVESRRRSLEIMLKKITAHPLLYGDPDIKFFLESESFAIEVVQRKKETSKGLFKIFGDAVSNATASFTKFSEPDEWFESRKYQVDQLEVQLKALYKSVELVSKQRKHLGDDHLDFGEALVALASAEVNKGLSKHFLELGNLQKKLKDIQELQSKQDSSTIAATAELYLRSIASVKACFASRTKSYSSWQTLEIEYEKKQTALIKAQGSKARPDKCSQLQTEVNQLERKVIAAKNEFEDMSKLVKDELDRFDKEKIEDFQVGIEEFLEKMIVNQREIVKLWENFI